MCHDVGASLTVGTLFYRDRAIGPLRRARREKGPSTKIRGTKRAQGESKEKGSREVNTQRWKAGEDGRR